MTRTPVDGWEQVLAEYKAVADGLHAGRTPRATADGLTVADLCNHFLTSKNYKLDASELSARMFVEYRANTDRMVAVYGKGRRVDDLHPDDFTKYRAGLTKQFGPVRVGDEVQKVRTVFKHGLDNGLVEKTVRFGSEFKKPNRKTVRLHRAKTGKKLPTADEVRALVAAAPCR